MHPNTIIDRMISTTKRKGDQAMAELAEIFFREIPNEGKRERRICTKAPFEGWEYFHLPSQYMAMRQGDEYLLITKDQLRRFQDAARG